MKYPHAVWKPLPENKTEPLITPRLFIVHTIVGGIRGADRHFRERVDLESTFLLGGPWDGEELDGVLWQIMDVERQANAQYKANLFATSVETSDGGDPLRPWSSKQLATLSDLGAWWCRSTGNPASLTRQWNGRGLGFHAQYPEWNPNRHSCPASVRIHQFRETVIPEIQRKLSVPVKPKSAGPKPPVTKPIPSWWHRELAFPCPVRTPGIRKQIRQRNGKYVWMQFGEDVGVVQKKLHLAADNLAGPRFHEAVMDYQERRPHLADDGIVGKATARELGN